MLDQQNSNTTRWTDQLSFATIMATAFIIATKRARNDQLRLHSTPSRVNVSRTSGSIDHDNKRDGNDDDVINFDEDDSDIEDSDDDGISMER